MKISVIVPVYNVAPYIGQCLDSILGQTLTDLELICVDDGSTDGTLEILREREQKDGRLRVLTQEHQFAGAARNRGIDTARGEYLIFLDGDDFFDPALLESMYARAVETNADVVCCGGRMYDNLTGEYKDWDCLDMRYVPNKPFFNARELGGGGYLFSTVGPINKIVRRSMVEKYDLRYQNLRTSNDLYFNCMCVSLAERISVCAGGKPLVFYRVGMTTNTQAKAGAFPLSFTESTLALKEGLEKHGLYQTLKRAFDCLVCFDINYYMVKYMNQPEAFATLFDWLRTQGREKYALNVTSLGTSQLSSLLATFDGVTGGMTAADARVRVKKNREKYGEKGMYKGHRLKRCLFMTGRLIGRMGLRKGLSVSLSVLRNR